MIIRNLIIRKILLASCFLLTLPESIGATATDTGCNFFHKKPSFICKICTKKSVDEMVDFLEKNGDTLCEAGVHDTPLTPEDLNRFLGPLELTQITTLSFHRTNITDEGAKEIASFLKTLMLKTLDLSGNKIGDEGLKALVEATQNLPASMPVTLILDNNKITNSGTLYLEEILQNDLPIKLISLKKNQIDETTIKKLANIVETIIKT